MSAVAVAAFGKMVGHSLKGKLVVILWNQGAAPRVPHQVNPSEIHEYRSGCDAGNRTISSA